MNVTPTDKMYEWMRKFTDETVGPEPGKFETTRPANQRREARRLVMDQLHTMVRLSMREGVARYLQERGGRTIADTIPPDPVASAVNKALYE